MPGALILDLHTFDVDLIDSDPDDDEALDEFLDHPSCGLNHKDGTCRKAGTDFCLRRCWQGGSRL